MLRCPPNSGSTFFNYKGHFSIQLLAVFDARFTPVDVGHEGEVMVVFVESSFAKALQQGTLHVQEACPVGKTSLTRCLVGDEAFL